jgi:hypothetical protein
MKIRARQLSRLSAHATTCAMNAMNAQERVELQHSRVPRVALAVHELEQWASKHSDEQAVGREL